MGTDVQPNQSEPETAEAEIQSSFQWNAFGWAGAVLGSSCWLLISAFFFAGLGWQLVVAGLFCFAASIVLGKLLWNRRESISYLRATQIFICGNFVLGISFWTCLAAFYDNFPFILKGYLAFSVYPFVAIWITWIAKRQQKVALKAN